MLQRFRCPCDADLIVPDHWDVWQCAACKRLLSRDVIPADRYSPYLPVTLAAEDAVLVPDPRERQWMEPR